MGLFGKPDTYRMEARNDVTGLMGALRHRGDAKVRVRAASSLAAVLQRSPTPKAGKALIRALADPEPGVRAEAAKALGHAPSPEAADALIKLLRDYGSHQPILLPGPFPEVVVEAANALAKIGDRRAVATLIGLLRSPHAAGASFRGKPLLTAVAPALRGFDDPAAIEAYFGIVQSLESLAAQQRTTRPDGLNRRHNELLQQKASETAGRYDEFIADIRSGELADIWKLGASTLAQLARSSNPRIRRECIRTPRDYSLVMSADKVRVFAALAEDAAGDVRSIAETELLEALSRIEDEQALRAAAQSKAAAIRSTAEERLADLSQQKAAKEEWQRREASKPPHVKALEAALRGRGSQEAAQAIAIATRHSADLGERHIKDLAALFKSIFYASHTFNQHEAEYRDWRDLRHDAERMMERLAELPQHHPMLRATAQSWRGFAADFDPMTDDSARQIMSRDSSNEAARVIERLLPEGSS